MIQLEYWHGFIMFWFFLCGLIHMYKSGQTSGFDSLLSGLLANGVVDIDDEGNITSSK
jgi:hypothetical protein